MNIGQYEHHMSKIEDAQRWYYQSQQQYDQLRTVVADTALAGETITDELKDAVADAKSDIELARKLFEEAKAGMIATVERMKL